MLSSANWFQILQRAMMKDPIRIAWATDLLAMGPHVQWVEPALWETATQIDPAEWNTILSEKIPSIERGSVYEAARLMFVRGEPSVMLWAGKFLLGMTDEPNLTRVISSKERALATTVPWLEGHAEPLPYLWARSGDLLRTRLLEMSNPLLGTMIDFYPEEVGRSVLDQRIYRAVLPFAAPGTELYRRFGIWNSGRDRLVGRIGILDTFRTEVPEQHAILLGQLRRYFADAFYEDVLANPRSLTP